jgi:serine/threonine-protein kinase ULK/ATG1
MCFRDYPFKGNYTSEVKLMEIMKKDCIEFPKVKMIK